MTLRQLFFITTAVAIVCGAIKTSELGLMFLFIAFVCLVYIWD
jgi:uncharacterized membrane protein